MYAVKNNNTGSIHLILDQDELPFIQEALAGQVNVMTEQLLEEDSNLDFSGGLEKTLETCSENFREQIQQLINIDNTIEQLMEYT